MAEKNDTSTPDVPTPAQLAARQADMEAEAEIVAALLHRATVQHISTSTATAAGTTSGSLTYLNRQLEAILSYYAAKGDTEALVRYQAEFLRLLQLVAEHVASFTVPSLIETPGSGKVTVN